MTASLHLFMTIIGNRLIQINANLAKTPNTADCCLTLFEEPHGSHKLFEGAGFW
jgi:hypothetical protein